MTDRIKEVSCSARVRLVISFEWHRALQKLNQLRSEADAALLRAEEAEAKNKKYEQEILQKDQEITSLNHKLSVLDAELEKTESALAEAKTAQADGESNKTQNEALLRKVQLLEEELDTAEKNVKETTERFVFLNAAIMMCSLSIAPIADYFAPLTD